MIAEALAADNAARIALARPVLAGVRPRNQFQIAGIGNLIGGNERATPDAFQHHDAASVLFNKPISLGIPCPLGDDEFDAAGFAVEADAVPFQYFFAR